jgi:hypothetical protein
MIYSIVPININCQTVIPRVVITVSDMVLNTSANLNYSIVDSTGAWGLTKTIKMVDSIYTTWGSDDYLYTLIATAENFPEANEQTIGTVKTASQLKLVLTMLQPHSSVATFLTALLDADGNMVAEYNLNMSTEEYNAWKNDDSYVITLLRKHSGWDIVLV